MTRLRATFVLVSLLIVPASLILAEDTPPESSETPVRTVHLTLRDGSESIWSGEVTIPDSDTATTSITATDGTTADTLAASALAALAAADAIAPEFSISNLQYFSSYGSFYTKCITAATEKCDNWQYVVDDAYPSIGMDQFLLQDSDSLFIYFGSPRRVTLSTTSVATNASFTATAEQYVPASDSYAATTGVTIGVTQPNPDDPYSPIIVATSTVDAAGSAAFTLSLPGTYALGIMEDYYYPASPLSVTEVAAEAEETPEEELSDPAPRSGGGGGSSAPAHVEMNVPAALSFLALNQREDGSFETALLTDWAAFAFAATPEHESGETMLRAYLTEALVDFSNVTDHERRAMALLALGVDPRTGTAVDHIAKILSNFDGTQFGNPSLVNDDIFALLPLLRTGYGPNDEEVTSALSFIIAKQRSDGSWDGSVDLTAAAIQAIGSLVSRPGVADAMQKAGGYLHAHQKTDGGFGNSFSTSWALQAIVARGENADTWQPAGKNPEDYLASLQASDGGLEPQSSDTRTRIWATEYAIPAALGKDWRSIMRSFEKSAVPENVVHDSIATTSPLSVSVVEEVLQLPAIVMEEIPIISASDGPSAPFIAAPLPQVSKVTSSPEPISPAIRHVAAAAAIEPAKDGIFARAWGWIARLGTAVRSLF